MKEELISFETANLAKEKGFEYVGNIAYTKSGQNSIFTNSISYIEYKYPINIVTQSLLQKWLREEKGTSVEVFTSKEGDKVFQISSNIIDFYNVSVDWESFKSFKTYEEALGAGLKKALELIK